MAQTISLGILGSTRGTVMLGLIQALQAGQLQATIDLVVSNKPEAMILENARRAALSALCINPKDFASDEQFHQALSKTFQDHHIQLIVLIGYMKFLSADFITQWRNQIINVHPSLLPAFAGGMDKNVHEKVLAAGVKESGCTVHYVTEEIDAGPILLQKKCAVLATDTIETLKTRVQALEVQALCDVINLLGNRNESPTL